MRGSRLRDWTDPVLGMTRPHTRRAGAILLVVSVLFVVSGYLGRVPFWPQSGTTVGARFENSSLLAKGAPVRIRGVDVGEVTGIRHPRVGEPALVEMRVEDGVASSLRSDTRAAIWWRTIFGGRAYVELDPGTSEQGLAGEIPARRTQIQVELDEVLRTFDDDARPAVRSALAQFRKGFADTAAVRRGYDLLPAAARQAAPALRALRGEWTGDLTRLVQRTARIASALAREEGALGDVIDGGELTLAVTAARRSEIAATLRALPAAQGTIRRQSAAVDATLDRLDPILEGALPAARRLDGAARRLVPANQELERAVRAARPLLTDLSPAAGDLRAAAVAGIPLVRDLMPTARRVRRSVVPFLRSDDRETGREVHQLLGPTIAAFDETAAMFDVNGHAARIGPSAGLNSVSALPCETLLLDPTAARRLVCDQLTGLARSLSRAIDRRRRR